MNSAASQSASFSGRRLLCQKSDLVANSGVCALAGQEQIALYYLPHEAVPLYALANWDPKGGANVLSRGIVGDLQGQLVVASPLYKHHFNLQTGQCLEDESVRVKTYPVLLEGEQVYLLTSEPYDSTLISSTRSIQSTCPYCGVGCGIEAHLQDSKVTSIAGSQRHPANFGRLCVKGSALKETLGTDKRLLEPVVQGKAVDWDTATTAVAEGLQKVIREHGPDAVAFYLSGQLLTEDYYVANKLMKGFIGSANVDTNSRLCMASAVAGYKRAFGADAVPCNYDDLEQTDLLILIGSNAAWTHPVLYQRMVAAKKTRPRMKVVMIDPRATVSGELADLHLQLRPGSDAFLFNGLLHYLHGADLADAKFLRDSCIGVAEAVTAAAACTIERVASQTGIAPEVLAQFYQWFGGHERVLSFYSQGINQSATGTDKCNAIINCHLLTGKIGKPGSGPFSITGQPNAMGGREVGGLANQLAAHMDFDTASVERVGRFWQSANMASQPGLRAVEMFDAIERGEIKAVWIMATNPVVSLPEADRVRAALRRCELVVVSDCVKHTDTMDCAHILLPATPFGEKDGTVTNSERRISRQRPLSAPAGNARHDWHIICDVARKMGFEKAFGFGSAHEIFIEHAALSGFENRGQRAFDISALQDLSASEYEALVPVQWPVNAANPQGTARLFADGRFYTTDGKARLVPVSATLPALSLVTPLTDAANQESPQQYPLLLNTGRLRDQWHTMSRTGEVPRLLRHVEGPCAWLNPADLQQQNLQPGALIELANELGTLCLPVAADPGVMRSGVFVPIHWNNQFASNARVSKLIRSTIDPWSGQPESKFARVALRSMPVQYWASLVSVRECPVQGFDYWHRVPTANGFRYLLAAGPDDAAPDALLQQLRDALSAPDMECVKDTAAGDYRYFLFADGILVAALFCHPRRENLPAAEWLEKLAGLARTSDNQQLLRHYEQQRQAKGRLVCSCFEVGENEIQQAIENGATDVNSLGRQLRCGTNCGSCIPELQQMLASTSAIALKADAVA